MSKITTVEFRNDTLFAVERDDGVFVAVTPICERLGLRPEKQRERIKNDPVLREGHAVVAFPSAGGVQDTFCLRLDLVNGWLFTIDESRVKPECRDAVLSYKRDCYAVLFRHFFGSRENVHEDTIIPPSGEEPVAVRRSLVTEARHSFSTQAARELWMKLGLPVVPAMAEHDRQGRLPFVVIDGGA